MRRLSPTVAAILATFAAGAQDIPFVPGQGTSEQLTEPERDVARLAIDALAADLQIAKEGILVDTIRAVDWPDSSIGCPQPGLAYLQVITRATRSRSAPMGKITSFMSQTIEPSSVTRPTRSVSHARLHGSSRFGAWK